ncbi:hypothetical protein R6Q57_009105 [Mikania cordata]
MSRRSRVLTPNSNNLKTARSSSFFDPFLMMNGSLGKVHSDEKRKLIETSNNMKLSSRFHKKIDRKPIKNCQGVVQEKKPYQGNSPLCNKCNLHHFGNCKYVYYNRCKKVGHYTKNCKVHEKT